jgi:hypothetical protein
VPFRLSAVVEDCMQAQVLSGSGMTPGPCGQTGNGLRRAMTPVAITSGSNLEISRDQLGKDALLRCKERLNCAALELSNTSLTWSPPALFANSAHCSPRLPRVHQQELIRGTALNSQADTTPAQEYDAKAILLESQFDYFEAYDEVVHAMGGTVQ